jgi:hypothetical protein
MRFCLLCLPVLLTAGVRGCLGELADPGESLTTRIQQVLAERKPHDQLRKLSDLGSKLSLEEIPQALAAAKDLKQWRQRAVLQQATLKHWAELAPAEAFDYIAKLPESRSKIEAIHYAVLKFANKDPERAASAVTKLSDGPSRMDAINTAAEIWAQTDARKALSWVDSLAEGGIRDSAVKSILFVWVHIDPVACYSRIQKLAPDNIKNALITNVAQDWAAFDPQGAIKWVNTLPEGSEKELGLQNVAESWADYDPELASEFALQLPQGPMRQQATAAVAERWATQNPQAAAEWITNKLDTADQQMALPRLLIFWAMESPQEAGKWAASLPAGPFRESAVQSYVEAVNNWAPDLGAKQAITLTDESVRNQKVETCVKHWMELDPISAQQWVKKANLPKYFKTRYLAPALGSQAAGPQ